MPAGKSPRTMDGLSGMTITTIAVGGSVNSSFFVCLVTDRGILLTHGSGKDGCLGHGDRNSVQKPKVKDCMTVMSEEGTDLIKESRSTIQIRSKKVSGNFW